MDDVEKVQRLHEVSLQLKQELAKVVIGQEDTVEKLLIGLFAGGHCLLVGVPGLAKTLLVRSLSQVLDLSFSRVQFTPDLMPSDITGTEVIQEDKASGARVFKFVNGPIFANLVLADEINRTPPKTQAALLEAMQEKQVTAAGTKHVLPDPFFVLATQNPIEQEGTYPLPEAQLDRFMFQVTVDYPSEKDELDVILNTTSGLEKKLNVVLQKNELGDLLDIVKQIPVAEHVGEFALKLVRKTRPQLESASEMIKKYVTWGSGPRGGQNLLVAGKAHAAMHGKFAVDESDIQAVCEAVLAHRIRTNFSADADNVTSLDIIKHVVAETVKESGFKSNGLLPNLFGSKTLSELKDLQLRASTIVDGLVTGMHRSPFQGNSVEFSQHREYVPGDDFRYVDWKVFARTDKVHVKQFEDETNLCCWLLVDQSTSMRFCGPKASLSKYDFACCCGVALAWLVLNQRDAIALATFSTTLNQLVRPSDQKENLANIVDTLEEARPQSGSNNPIEQTDFKSSLGAIAVEAQKRGVVVVISDCFDDFESLASGMENLRRRKHQVILLQILDPSELHFDLSQPVQMKGMESDLSVRVDPISLRKAYTEVVESSTKMIEQFCQKQDIDFQQVTSDTNIASVLQKILRGRRS